jgi:hypothetical protein
MSEHYSQEGFLVKLKRYINSPKEREDANRIKLLAKKREEEHLKNQRELYRLGNKPFNI